MDFLRRLFTMKRTKPYKVQDAERKIGRIGVTATGLSDLKKKAASKLKIDSDFRVVVEQDGTEVDDENYFASLPEQTAFVCLKPGEHWDGYISYLKLATKKIVDNISPGSSTVEMVQTIFRDTNSQEFAAIMNYIKELDVNIDAETITDDPEWFDGVVGKFKTKEQVLKRSSQQRIRGYLNNSKEFIIKSESDKITRAELLDILDKFKKELKRNKYFEDYFARSASVDARICDETGWFACEGQNDEKQCEQLHRINPYGSRDHRVLFRTWNLDHRIEKSREILPTLVQAVVDCPKIKEINWEYFFSLLFTRDNLKLVDVRCHIISSHDDYKVDKRRIYRKKKRAIQQNV